MRWQWVGLNETLTPCISRAPPYRNIKASVKQAQGRLELIHYISIITLVRLSTKAPNLQDEADRSVTWTLGKS